MDRVTEMTYRMERRRALAAGVLETAGTTFLLLVAVRAFSAGPTAKGVIASGGALGLLLTPWTVWYVAKRRWRATQTAAWFARTGGAAYLVAAVVPSLTAYVIASTVALTALMGMVPLLTQMLEANYPAKERGKRFSNTVIIRILSSMAFAWAAGTLLTDDMARYPLVLLAYAAAFLLAGDSLSRCPSRPVPKEAGESPTRVWRYVKEDRTFRITLWSWMFMGIGNLMMLPLRVEYLANPKYGLTLSAGAIAFYTTILPNMARGAMSAVWGRLFDRMDFFAMRAVLNVGFALNIFLFFLGGSVPALVAASLIFGVSSAGGDIAWSLWVTKLAPSNRTAGYMSIHTFTNGIRSALAPLIAFWFVEGRSIHTLAWISGGLILVATLMLVPSIGGGHTSGPKTVG